MTLRLTNVTSRNNGGDGLRIEGQLDVDVRGFISDGNRGDGVGIYEMAPFMQSVGLSSETDPKALAALLQQLVQLPVDERNSRLREPGVLARMGKFTVDGTTVLNNILSIAASPSVQAIIQRLSGGA